MTFLLRETPPAIETETHSEASDEARGGPAEESRRFPRSFWIIVVVLIFFSLANSSDAFLLLRAADAGLSPLMVIFVYALYNLSYALASYPAGILSDRLGRWRLIAVGWIIYVLVYAGFAIATEWSVWPLMALYGCYMALTEGVGKALVADHAPPQRRATAMGILHMSMGLSILFGSVFAGWLWDRFGAPAPFWFGAGGAALALMLLVVLSPLLIKPSAVVPVLFARGME